MLPPMDGTSDEPGFFENLDVLGDGRQRDRERSGQVGHSHRRRLDKIEQSAPHWMRSRGVNSIKRLLAIFNHLVELTPRP